MPNNTPPIRVKALMKLAWGLTLNLSGDETQQKTGEMFKDRFVKLWESSTLTNNDKNYLNEIMTSLSTFLRNLGFEKDFLVKELDISQDIREEEIKSINDLADLTSLSNEGLISRIVAFLFGGASIFPLIARLFPYEADNAAPTEKVITTTAKETGDITKTIVEKYISDAPPELAVPTEILIFLVGRGIGIFALTLGIKLIKGWWIKHVILKHTIEDQQGHWEAHVREGFKSRVSVLLDDIINFTRLYYPIYYEPILGYIKSERDNFIDSLLPKKDLYVHSVKKKKKK
jgi:hypothetical protein